MMENPQVETNFYSDYTPLTKSPERLSPFLPALMNMTIAARRLTNVHRPPQIRQDGLEVGNDRSHALSFRLQPQQGLFKIEIERQRLDQMESELRTLASGRVWGSRAGQFNDLAL
jgi:hypothetical protein